MIELNLPDLNQRSLEIEQDTAVTKGGTTIPKNRLAGKIGLSDPRYIHFTPDLVKDDPEAKKFITVSGKLADFFLLHLICTFYPIDGQLFEQAWLHVDLRRYDGNLDLKPEVWSMRPERLSKPVEISNTVKVGSSLKFMDVGAETGGETKASYTEEDIFLRAYEFPSEPFWEFQRSDLQEIRGSYRLALIVKVPKGIIAQADARIRATIRRRRLGILLYRTDFPGAPVVSVRLDA